MNEWIWFDMDGTIADFYSVDGWLDDLLARNTRPYELAKPIYNMTDLLSVLVMLKFKGYKIGIISWCSRENNAEFNKATEIVKRRWLADNGFSLVLDEIIITSYGTNKADICRPYGNGILVDDEKPNRDSWNIGNTINANENILKALMSL